MKKFWVYSRLWQGLGLAGCDVPSAEFTSLCFMIISDSLSVAKKILQSRHTSCLSYNSGQVHRDWDKLMLEYWLHGLFKKQSCPD